MAACVTSGFQGFGRLAWPLGFWIPMWSLGFQVPGIHGFPSTVLVSSRMGVFCQSCGSGYGVKRRGCCLGLGFQVPIWPLVEKEYSARIVGQDQGAFVFDIKVF